jgi:steroid 5-alpha reductase family enzyme
MTEGLFRYSVYANYFGECTLWWGATLLSLPAARSPLNMVAAFLAPCFDAYLLFRVSGIPLSDASSFKKYGGRPDYLDYRARTSLFFPSFPKQYVSEADLERVRQKVVAAKSKNA